MSRTDHVPETSMEEILASIRRIITEDTTEEPRRPAAAAKAWMPRLAGEDDSDDIANDIARALEMADQQDEPDVSEADDDILELATAAAAAPTYTPGTQSLAVAAPAPSAPASPRSLADELAVQLAKLETDGGDLADPEDLIGAEAATPAAPDGDLEDLLEEEVIEMLADPLPDSTPMAEPAPVLPVAVAPATTESAKAEAVPAAEPIHEASPAPASGPDVALGGAPELATVEATEPAVAASPLDGAGTTAPATPSAPDPAPEVIADAPTTAIAAPASPVAAIATAAAKETASAPALQSAAAEAGFPSLPSALIEDTAAELLKPMLREWLDANMPRLIAKAMSGETVAKS